MKRTQAMKKERWGDYGFSFIVRKTRFLKVSFNKMKTTFYSKN